MSSSYITSSLTSSWPRAQYLCKNVMQRPLSLRRWKGSHAAFPRVGVSVAVVRDAQNPYNMNVTNVDKWDILLIKRGKEPSKGLWSVPGGSLNLGETLVEGGKREVLEETGLQVNVGDVFSTIDGIHKDDKGETKFHYVLVDLLGVCADPDNFHPIPSDDAADARWVPIKNISSAGPTTDGLQGVIEKMIANVRAGVLTLPSANSSKS